MTDDNTREALADLIDAELSGKNICSVGYKVADAILAAGWRPAAAVWNEETEVAAVNLGAELKIARATIAAQAKEIERLKAERTTKECDHVWIYITNTTAPHRYCDKCGKRSNHV